MSKELPSKNNTSEEVDLVVFFNLIGGILNKVLNFVGSILKTIFSAIIYAIRAFVVNWKIILGAIVISTVLGYFIEHKKAKVYNSEMLVRPYFGSKFQLVTNINYFNALIKSKDYDALENIFNNEETKVDTKQIKSFKIEPGPTTENQRILQYEEFISQVDSIRAQDISLEDYVENRSIYSGDLFLITAESFKKDIFRDLEFGINSAFTNDFSERKKKKENQLYELEKENILENLKEVDSLQRIYIDVLQEETKNPSKDFNLGPISLQQEKSGTKEYELLEKEIKLREQLRALEEKAISKDVFVDVISSFQKVGNVVDKLSQKYSLIFPALTLILICLLFMVRKVVVYASNYEG